MKIASYLLGGRSAYGVVTDGGLITVSKGLGSKYASLRAVLEADALEEIRAAADG